MKPKRLRYAIIPDLNILGSIDEVNYYTKIDKLIQFIKSKVRTKPTTNTNNTSGAGVGETSCGHNSDFYDIFASSEFKFKKLHTDTPPPPPTTTTAAEAPTTYTTTTPTTPLSTTATPPLTTATNITTTTTTTSTAIKSYHFKLWLPNTSDTNCKWIILRIDTNIYSNICIHFDLFWIACDSWLIEEFINTLYIRCRSWNLKCIQIPEIYVTSSLYIHPYRPQQYILLSNQYMKYNNINICDYKQEYIIKYFFNSSASVYKNEWIRDHDQKTGKNNHHLHTIILYMLCICTVYSLCIACTTFIILYVCYKCINTKLLYRY